MRVRVFVFALALVLVFVLALVLTRIAREGRSPSALTLWASLGIFGITVVGLCGGIQFNGITVTVTVGHRLLWHLWASGSW